MNSRADLLIVTATKVESAAVIQALEAVTNRKNEAETIGDRTYRNFGVVNHRKIFMVQTEPGSVGVGAALSTVAKGIEALSPSSVIMVGIAFGLRPEKQRIGDILVSKQVRPYEQQRIGTKDGKPHIIPRGPRPDASANLLNYLRTAEQTWRGQSVSFGVIVSGEHLVDHLEFRQSLLEIEPEALGGEMEGPGLYAACQDAKVDWILAKAICDWADGNKADDKEARQKLAAEQAAGFLIYALECAPMPLDRRPPAPQRMGRIGVLVLAVVFFVMLALFGPWGRSRPTKEEAALNQLRIRVEGMGASADTAARLTGNLELRRLAAELRQAADEFDARNQSQQTPKTARNVRLARARAAIVEGRYREALDLVTEADLTPQTPVTVSMLLVRADACFGLRQWAKAKGYYQRILGIEPTHIGALFGAGNSARYLRQPAEAASTWDRLIGSTGNRNSSEGRAVLGSALNNRATAYRDLGQMANGIADNNRAVAILEELVNGGRTEFISDLAMALNNRGVAYFDKGELTNAITDDDRAIGIWERSEGHGIDLAMALMNRSIAYSTLGHPTAALADSNRAIEILDPLVKERPELANDLALAYVNRSGPRRHLGQWTDITADCNRAIEILEQLVRAERPELNSDLAIALMNRGAAYGVSGELTNAIADCNRAIDVLSASVGGESLRLSNPLAMALRNRGFLYSRLSEPTNAIADYCQAIEILEPLVGGGVFEVSNELASVLNNRAVVYRNDLGQLANSLADYNRAIQLWEPMLRSGSPSVTNDLATALHNRSTVRAELGQLANALQDCSRAILFRESLVKSGTLEQANDLAMTLDARGQVYGDFGQPKNSVMDHSRAIAILQPLIKERPDLANNLAKALLNRSASNVQLGQLTNVVADSTRAIEIWTPLADGMTESTENLAKALHNRGLAYVRLGQLTNAIEDLRQATVLMEGLVGKGRLTKLRPEFAKLLVQLAGLLLSDGRPKEARPYLTKAIELEADAEATRAATDLKKQTGL